MVQPPQLRIPGPTPVPERVQRAMAAPMINHRGPEFRALLPELEAGLRWAFQTESDMLIFPASGTGGLESAVANVVSPGERVLAVTIGAFGDRFADLAEAFGADVARLTLPWGEAADPEDLDALLLQEGVQLKDLLLGDLHLFQEGGDLLERQESAFLTLGDERAQLVHLKDGCFIAEQNCGLSAQPSSFATQHSRIQYRGYVWHGLPLSKRLNASPMGLLSRHTPLG